MSNFPKDMKIVLTLGEVGIERIQVRSDRETQREAINVSVSLTDLIDDFENKFLERIKKFQSGFESAR